MINSQKLGLTLGPLIALGIAGANAAHAQTTIVDSFYFNTGSQTYTGPGVLGLGSTNAAFKPINTSSFPQYTDDGALTTLISENTGGTSGLNYSSGSPAAPNTDPSILLNGQAYTSNTTATFYLINLDPSKTYDVVLYGGAINSGVPQPTKFTVIKASGTLPAAQTTSDTQVSSFANGVNYVEFTGLTPILNADSGRAGSGLGFSFTAASGQYGHFNGLQVEITPPAASPEPSQLAGIAFTALGALGLVLKARKRNLSGVA